MSKEILLDLPNGTQFIYTRLKKRARVDVRNQKYNVSYMTYRFNNIPLYQHQYLSWENLNCCNGWRYDESYLEKAVQQHKKLVADIVVVSQDAIDIDVWKNSYGFNEDETEIYIEVEMNWNGKYNRYRLIATRKGCLADFYNLEEIVEVYNNHGIDLGCELKRIKELWQIPLSILYSGEGREKYNFDFFNPYSCGDLVINGLALGYPIESTVGILV